MFWLCNEVFWWEQLVYVCKRRKSPGRALCYAKSFHSRALRGRALDDFSSSVARKACFKSIVLLIKLMISEILISKYGLRVIETVFILYSRN